MTRLLILCLALVGTAHAKVPDTLFCSGYDYPYANSPVALKNAQEARELAAKNRANITDIEVFQKAISKAVGDGAIEVAVRVPKNRLCPPIVKKHFEANGYKVTSTNAKCKDSFSCPDWGYCEIRWGR